MKGLKNRRFVFEMDSARVVTLTTKAGKFIGVTDCDGVRRASRAAA
jgi:hypothetical protein